MGNKTRPSAYQPPLPFHAVRGFTALSVVVVGSILSYFCYQLTADSFKLPWTFLVMLLADLLLLLSLLIGTVLYFCSHLSPLLNMICNTPILILWTAAMILLTWNMYGALGNACSAANWGNADGMSVCNQYKALYAFVVIGWLCQIALIVLDIRARRSQSALGRYNKMDDTQDMKLDLLDHSRDSSVHSLPLGTGLDGASQRLQQQQQQEAQQPPQNAPQRALTRASSYYSEAPSQAPSYASQAPAYTYAASQAPTYTTQPRRQDVYQDASYQSTQNSGSAYQAYNPTTNGRFDPGYSTSHSVSMNDFGYQPRADQTRYDNYYGR